MLQRSIFDRRHPKDTLLKDHPHGRTCLLCSTVRAMFRVSPTNTFDVEVEQAELLIWMGLQIIYRDTRRLLFRSLLELARMEQTGGQDLVLRRYKTDTACPQLPQSN
eukprot:TRINITY_DN221_c0_g1_i5.p2 TRINITY_DN221_c0_g1~~TRINITY_DN221_c0_g1_i5.p2  ORF type:complete len:107 (+),score=0.35 TRINITY_DN221_c0_g1_i5:490-810(+)